MLINNGGLITDSLDLSSLAKVTDGYTQHDIHIAVTTMLTEKRIQQVCSMERVFKWDRREEVGCKTDSNNFAHGLWNCHVYMYLSGHLYHSLNLEHYLIASTQTIGRSRVHSSSI